MPSFDKRLKELEALERRAEGERHDAWLRSLSDDELDTLIEGYRRENPEAWARVEAMTDDELDTEIERSTT